MVAKGVREKIQIIKPKEDSAQLGFFTSPTHPHFRSQFHENLTKVAAKGVP